MSSFIDSGTGLVLSIWFILTLVLNSKNSFIDNYCTLRGRDQRLNCAFIFIFYGAMLYLPNFRKIQHTWANTYRTLGKI